MRRKVYSQKEAAIRKNKQHPEVKECGEIEGNTRRKARRGKKTKEGEEQEIKEDQNKTNKINRNKTIPEKIEDL